MLKLKQNIILSIVIYIFFMFYTTEELVLNKLLFSTIMTIIWLFYANLLVGLAKYFRIIN